MQSGGQYGVPPEVPQYGVVNTRGPPTTTHAHIFNLSHEVAGGLGLSSSTPTVSHGGHHGHGGHAHAHAHVHAHGQSPHPQYQQGQSQHRHHQQQQAAATQPYLHFQDQQTQHQQQHQSLQSAQHQATATIQQEQAQTHHQQQPQKQAMVPSVVVQHHSQEQLQQAPVLQQQYQQQQQHLVLGLESPKVLSPMANRQQPPPSSAATVTAGNITAAAAAAAGSQYSKALQAMADQSALDDTDGLGDEGDRGTGGNRWPRQETLALLKIRSEMDASFRDSSLKRPLWEEVSRKLAELGYQRSAKKCKEKFENVHKYYKRTKEGKAGRQDGKNYRFFSELEALSGNAGHTIANRSLNTNMFSVNTRSGNVNDVLGSTTGNPQARDMSRSPASFLLGSSIGGPSRTADLTRPINPGYRPILDDNSGMNFSSETSSSDDDNDDEYEDPSDVGPRSKKRKRKSAGRMMAFFESLLKKVMEKQEQMQQRFLEALERREQDRMIREEAWKRQDMARMSREHELRAQERSLAATRDAAIVAFLQKVTGQTIQLPSSTAIAIAAQPVQSHAPAALSNPTLDHALSHPSDDQDPFDPSSRRWPKPEVLALIQLRTGLHSRFTEPGPKGPLWEDISNSMSRLGYNRNSKRCKEKWENINKYFKKAKESNKNRPENAKTCPYYHQLDALYKQGVLGGGTAANIKQLPYKPSTDHLDVTDNPMQVQQPSTSNRDGGPIAHVSTADQVLAIMPPASQLSTASDATASTSNVNVSANVPATHLFSITNPDSGGLSKEINLKSISDPPPMRALDGDDDDKVVAENPSRQELSEEMTIRTSLQLQGQASSMDDHHHHNMNQGYVQKVDLEQEARLVDEEESHQQQQVIHQQQQMAHQQQVQYPQERPAGLAPPPPSSFIANMLQKFSNDPAESNTSSTSANQE